MAKYYVDNEGKLNGDHEVHAETCPRLPDNSQYLGEFSNCFEALKAARKYYIWANGCHWCSRPCQTR
jgi:hypothetical protein